MPQLSLTTTEQTIINALDDQQADMLSTVKHWSAQNSGSHNRAGLDVMRGLLHERFSALPGVVTDMALASGSHIADTGEVQAVDYAPALHVQTRPDAPVQLVLTGHYDTVSRKIFIFKNPCALMIIR